MTIIAICLDCLRRDTPNLDKFGNLIGGAVVVEFVFAMPGM